MNEDEEKDPVFEPSEKNFIYYISEYRGAIIGVIFAFLLIVTGLSKLLISLIIIVAGGFLGNYIQKNKNHVKDSLKGFIDKF